MLCSIHIKDFAIIDELEVSFAPGLNMMTGETGAGKTIIVEAINLVLGGRAQSDLVRHGSEKASVTAVFDISVCDSFLLSELSAMGVSPSDELIVHRIVGGAGKGKISINGIPVTGGMLKNIAERLVDVSSQHEHQLLLDSERHAEIVDSYGNHHEELSAYRGIHRMHAEATSRLRTLEKSGCEAKDKLDFFKFQLGELESADIRPGEDAELESLRSRLKHSVVLEEKMRGAQNLLYEGAQSAIEAVGTSMRMLDECTRYDESISALREGLVRAHAEVEDVAREISKYISSLDSDPQRLEEVEERIHLIRSLVKKHGGSLEECLAKVDFLREEIYSIDNFDERIAELRSEVEELSRKRRVAAKVLSVVRVASSARMSKAIASELSELGMSKTSFMVEVRNRDEELWDENGGDAVEFLLAPNVGEPMMPLAKIASGGELSRVMLAVKSALSERGNPTATSIFDEVDSGIGGRVADVVGKKLKKVSRNKQVICITHLPQVAVYGDAHIRIAKGVKKGRTVTSLSTLKDAERVDEIARMLGGEKITEATIAHASEMFRSASRSQSGGK